MNRKFRILNMDLGYPMWASTALMEFGSHFSDQAGDATEFVEGEDNPETKLKWFRAVASNAGYNPEKVTVEWVVK